MARISEQAAGGRNVLAFLDTIAWSEIGPGLLALSDDGYNVLVGATPEKPLLFYAYADHPDIYNARHDSTAAGRYQILHRYWPYYRRNLGLPDFSPLSQDRYALEMIRERHALPLIKQGHIHDAIATLAGCWASFPPSRYDQPVHTFDELITAYVRAGGTLAQ